MNLATIQLLEDEAKHVLEHAVAAFKALQAMPTVQAIEEAWPEAAKFAERIAGVIPYLGQAELALDLILKYGPALFAFAQAAGIKPMDANQMADDDAKFHPGYSQD